MSIDEGRMRQIIREEREEADRRAADKAERDELRARVDRLEAKRKEPDHEAEPDDKGDDHPFEA